MRKRSDEIIFVSMACLVKVISDERTLYALIKKGSLPPPAIKEKGEYWWNLNEVLPRAKLCGFNAHYLRFLLDLARANGL